MKRWPRLLSLLLVAACSGLEEGEGGVVAIEVETPEDSTLEVGEQVQVVAHALDVDGQVVEVPLQWQSTAAAVTVDGTGLVTGVQPGPADVQAFSGSLPSEPVSFVVLARADTIIIAGDSVFTLPIAVEPPPVATLTVRLETFTPPGPVAEQPIIFEITSPAPGTTPVVQLAGGVQIDTVTTADDGTASAVISAVSGQIAPDTAIVQVRAERSGGARGPRLGPAVHRAVPVGGAHARDPHPALLRGIGPLRAPIRRHAGQARRALDPDRVPRGRRAGPGLQPGPPGAGRAARRPGRDPVGEPTGVGDHRLCVPRRPRRRRAHLSHAPCPAGRVHPPRQRRGGGRRVHRRPVGEGAQRAHAAAGPGARDRAGRRDRRTGRAELRRGARPRSSGARPAPRVARLGTERGAGRSRDADLYLGHHRRPQGRDAVPRQHRVERDHLRRSLQLHGRGRVPLVPAAVSHLRADVRPLLHVPRGSGDQLRREHRRGARQHGGDPTPR